MGSEKQWTSDSREQRLFERPFWPYKLHTFSRVKRVKKYATSKAKMALKKAFVHEETDVHSFESQTSLTNFIMHVEHICLRFFLCIRVYYLYICTSTSLNFVFEGQLFTSLQNCPTVFWIWRLPRVFSSAFGSASATSIALPHLIFGKFVCYFV